MARNRCRNCLERVQCTRVSASGDCSECIGIIIGRAALRRPMISNANDFDVTFEGVLEIAQAKTPEAKTELEKVRDAGPDDGQVPMLARRILNRWDNNNNNTYHAEVPQLLESTCVDTEQLKAMYPGEVEAMRLYVEIRVDADGRPVRASVLGGTDDRPLKEAVVHTLMQKRYVPAKERDAYVDATLTVQCRLEVR
jgi:hypothetical protein